MYGTYPDNVNSTSKKSFGAYTGLYLDKSEIYANTGVIVTLSNNLPAY